MDDDAPLSALTKAPKFEDDTPLIALAVAGKPKPTPAKPAAANPNKLGRPASSDKLKVKPQVVAGAKRKKDESSSSSSSSDSSDSSSDSDGPIKKKKKVKVKVAGGLVKKGKGSRNLLKKKQTEENLEEDGDFDGGGAVKGKDRTAKETAVAELLSRWWYAMPDWPPNDPKLYIAELKKRSYRKVSVQEWEWVPEVDSDGLKKVYELSQFRGVFRDSAGNQVDCRPQETCPCFNNFMKKDLGEMYSLLVKAYEKQLELLETSHYDEKMLKIQIKTALVRTQKRAYEAGALKA